MTINELLASVGLTANDEIPLWDAEATGAEPTKKITATNLATAIKSLASLLGTSDVVNNLTSTETTKALSAAQGKALADAISVSSTSATRNTTYTGNGSCNLHKFGKIVVMYMVVKGAETAPGTNTLFTIPEGYRPADDVSFMAGATNSDGFAKFYIQKNSEILRGASASTNIVKANEWYAQCVAWDVQ